MCRALALLLSVAASVQAQNFRDSILTADGVCRLWVNPPGGSNFPRDASYARCALDRLPVLRPGPIDVPTPRFARSVSSSLRLVINADGSVDPELTRPLTRSFGDKEFFELAHRAMSRWRFVPAVRGGRPVRVGLDLTLVTDVRVSDTMPALVTWEYRRGERVDTLRGTWANVATTAPFTSQQVDSVHAAMLRQLTYMGVVRPTVERSYCLSADDTSRAGAARLARMAAVAGLPTTEARDTCVDSPSRVRLALPPVHRTENGRAVVFMRGTQLPRWPFDFDAMAWSRWKARCVGTVTGNITPDMTCDVSAESTRAEDAAWQLAFERPRPAPRAPRTPDEPLNIALLVTATGAYGIDTVRAVVPAVARIQDFALRDTVFGANGWYVWSPHRVDSTAYVAHGNPRGRRLTVTRAQSELGPAKPQIPERTLPTDGPDRFVAFLLGGLGTNPQEAVTLCFEPCDRRYLVDPRRNLLQPALHFPLRELREITRSADEALRVRLMVDPVPDSLVVLLAFRTAGEKTYKADVLRDLGGGLWEWNVLQWGTDWSKTDAFVYLMRR